jgi:glutamate-ammonia-ligase adenylyltransferase
VLTFLNWRRPLEQANGSSLLAGLAGILGNVWSLEQVTGALARLADAAVDVSLKRLVGAELRAVGARSGSPDDAETAAGMVNIATGKGGAV